jgi:hypothetical protein
VLRENTLPSLYHSRKTKYHLTLCDESAFDNFFQFLIHLLYDGVQQSRTLGGRRHLDPHIYSTQTYGSNTTHSIKKIKTQSALSVSDKRKYCLLGDPRGALVVCLIVSFTRNFYFYPLTGNVSQTPLMCASRFVPTLGIEPEKTTESLKLACK